MYSKSFGTLAERERTLLKMLSPAVVVLIAVTIIPIIQLFWTSLHKMQIGTEKSFILFDNYIKIANDPRFWNSVVLAIVLIAMAVGLQVFLGLIIAERFNQSFKGKELFRIFILLPMVCPPIVVGIIWRMLLQPTLGAASYYLGLIGIDIAWLAGAESALIAIALVDAWQWMPFVILMFMAGLSTIPDELLDAAKVDGANQFQIFIHIFLPLLKPVIMITVLLRVIDSIKIFPKIFIMTQGGPGTATEIINYYAFRTTFQYSRFGYGAALCFNMFIIALLLSIAIIMIMRVRSE